MQAEVEVLKAKAFALGQCLGAAANATANATRALHTATEHLEEAVQKVLRYVRTGHSYGLHTG